MSDGDLIWELDSANGLLSFTKMKYEQDLKMVRKATHAVKQDVEAAKAEDNHYETYPVCGTSTGWFTECCGRSRHSDIQEGLGVGISTYFK